jgi:hypothetical protein
MPKPPPPVNKTTIIAKLESVSPERQQYKPYMYNLLPQDVYVELELEPEQIAGQDSEKIILNLDGFTAVLCQLADAIDEMHDGYVIKARKGGKY